jgi:hypothetical protein
MALRAEARASVIAGAGLCWVKRQFPADQGMQIIHEAIVAGGRAITGLVVGLLRGDTATRLRARPGGKWTQSSVGCFASAYELHRGTCP